MKKHKKLRRIIEYYGINNQLKYFQSEVFELTEAVLDYEKTSLYELFSDAFRSVSNYFAGVMQQPLQKDPRKEHIIEEIADVMVMLKQIQLNYNIKTDEIKEVMQFKIDRQLKRIEDENNN